MHVLLAIPDIGSLSVKRGRISRGDMLYFSGLNFTTIGYTSIDATGTFRLIAMMQSLGGFVVLTWSAAFLSSVWREALSAK